MSADDWIKTRRCLSGGRVECAIAEACGISPNEALGAMVRLLIWADSAADEDGFVARCGQQSVRKVSDICPRENGQGADTFGTTLADVGWLSFEDNGVRFLDWGMHNGSSAKKRASDARNKAARRKLSAVCPQIVRAETDKARTREEKSREEKKREENTTGEKIPKKKKPPEITWTKDGGFVGIANKHRKKWSGVYPSIDLDAELVKMDLWLGADDERIPKSFARFIVGWLGRKYPVHSNGTPNGSAPTAAEKRRAEQAARECDYDVDAGIARIKTVGGSSTP